LNVAKPVSTVNPRLTGNSPPSLGNTAMNTTMSVTIVAVAAVTLQNGVLNLGWIRANERGACPCRPISEPILDAARIDAFEADTIEKTAPATISDRPIGPRNPAATSPIAVSPSSAITSAGTVEFVIATMTSA
jgi:hypothetical protein